MQPGGPPIKGEDVVRTMFQMDINYSKWWLTLLLVLMAVAYRTLFFFAMKLRERVPMIMNMIEKVSSRQFVVPYDIKEDTIDL